MLDDPNNHMPSEHKLAKALSYWRAPAAACGAMKLMPHLTLRRQRLPRASREGRPLPAAWLKAEPPAAGAPPRPAPTPGLPSPAVPRGQSMQGPGRRGRGAAPGTYRQRLGRARRVPGTWGPCGSLALTHRSLGASCQPRSPVRVKVGAWGWMAASMFGVRLHAGLWLGVGGSGGNGESYQQRCSTKGGGVEAG